MLLFCISTAYTFAMMRACWSLMTGGRPH